MTRRLLSRALQLAQRGWHVFPLRPFDKRPLPGFTKWEERATINRAQIIKWWTAVLYNIGIATGPSGLLVLDCDIPRGADPSCWRRVGDRVEILGRRLPRTFSVATPSGGLHLYFRAPDQPLGNTAGKLGLGIDTRGIGGYVVGPGSVCSGRYYTITDASPVVKFPSFLIGALAPRASAAQASPLSVQHHEDKYLRAILEGEAERVRTAPVGSRNNALNIAAFILGQLVGGAELSEQEARAILSRAVRTHLGIVGFSPNEAERTITSGLIAGAKYPRRVRGYS
jgi:hypothetical protein